MRDDAGAVPLVAGGFACIATPSLNIVLAALLDIVYAWLSGGPPAVIEMR